MPLWFLKELIGCACGETHAIVDEFHDDPVIECPQVLDHEYHLVDTRLVFFNGVRAFTGWDGPLWIRGCRKDA